MALICFDSTAAFAQQAIALVGGILLIAGLWTPVMGTLIALDELSIALSTHSTIRPDACIYVFVAGVAVSLSMLGPGAWSIDARLFGRKRIDLNSSGRRRVPLNREPANRPSR
jgi:putative oxidoreductase